MGILQRRESSWPRNYRRIELLS